MDQVRVRVRRARRTDFTAVMHLLAGSGVPVPPPDRGTLRRFRYLVADLGTDFYLGMIDDALAGLVHVTYARQLAVQPHARVDHLLVAEPFRRRGVGTALMQFAQQRAQKRGCGMVSCVLAPDTPISRQFLERAGLQPAGEWFAQRLELREE